jgi:1-deoxy-D-xylulose-5-phosphate synthase
MDQNKYSLLSEIRSPEDLKSLTHEELERLAAEIRTFLIDHVSRTGGHLGPNLGIVEVTIAVHRVFNSPQNPILFDTGHQSYVHKILTGRAEKFTTLRQPNGLSGYPNRSESEHDWFENSHASTGLSYALGLAQARQMKGIKDHVVVIVGDGALTGGMAYEALNNISQIQPNIIIILNDNGRSYAPTVGGLAKHLAWLRLNPAYEQAKKELSNILRDIPAIGTGMDEFARRLKGSLKQLVEAPTLFDLLNIKYSGPVDGHNIRAIETALQQAVKIGGPVVIHVITEKGRGYQPAIQDEVDKFHSISVIDPETGEAKKSGPTYTDVLGNALLEAAKRRANLVAITAAMASSTGLLEFSRVFPTRFYDVGIAEQHAVTFSAGLALGGAKPVVCIYSTFLQRAFDQVIMDVCLHNLPVVFVLDRAGITGPDGPSHHGMFDLSYLRLIPNISICTPKDEEELCALLETALDHDGPVAIRYPKESATHTPIVPQPALEFGKWEKLTQGEDVLILAVGRMVKEAIKAYEMLLSSGISATVVNARWVKPIDMEMLMEGSKNHRLIITVEDNAVTGGFGSGVREQLGQYGVTIPVVCLGLPDSFIAHGNPKQILENFGLCASNIAEVAKDMLMSLDLSRSRA